MLRLMLNDGVPACFQHIYNNVKCTFKVQIKIFLLESTENGFSFIYDESIFLHYYVHLKIKQPWEFGKTQHNNYFEIQKIMHGFQQQT